MKEGMGRLPGAGGPPSGGLSAVLPLVRDSAPAGSTWCQQALTKPSGQKCNNPDGRNLVWLGWSGSSLWRRPALLRFQPARPEMTNKHERAMGESAAAPGTS